MARKVLITGATSGYGLESAKLFQKNGDTVIIASRNEDKVSRTVRDFGFAVGYKLDVTHYEEWVALKEKISKDFGTVDILVNNAGGGVKLVNTVDQTKETIDEAISLNLTSSIYASQIFAPDMIAQKDGIIINVSSICARHQWGTWTIYGAAKAGLLSFSKGLYTELRPHGVRVTCVLPGRASTGFQSNSGIEECEESMTPTDIANAILYCANQPKGVVVEEITVWGTSQDVQPL